MNIVREMKENGNRSSERVARFVVEDPGRLSQLLTEVVSESKRVKNAAAKSARIISERQPGILLPQFRFFSDLIHHDDTILRWIAIDVIGNLSAVDDKGYVDIKILRELFGLLSNESMITASHSIDALGKIAQVKARYRRRITEELRRVEVIERNKECRNILPGRVIDSYRRYSSLASKKERQTMLALATRQRNNRRSSTRKRAELFVGMFVNS